MVEYIIKNAHYINKIQISFYIYVYFFFVWIYSYIANKIKFDKIYVPKEIFYKPATAVKATVFIFFCWIHILSTYCKKIYVTHPIDYAEIRKIRFFFSFILLLLLHFRLLFGVFNYVQDICITELHFLFYFIYVSFFQFHIKWQKFCAVIFFWAKKYIEDMWILI